MSATKEDALTRNRRNSGFRRRFAEVAGSTGFVYAIADSTSVLISALISHWVYFGSLPVSFEYRVTALFGMAALLLIFSIRGLSSGIRGWGFVDHARAVFGAWAVWVSVLLACGFLTDSLSSVSNEWSLMWVSSTLLALVLLRFLVVSLIRSLHRHGFNVKRVVVVGEGPNAHDVVARLEKAGWLGLHIVRVLGLEAIEKGGGEHSTQDDSGYHELPQLLEDLNADEVWICLPVNSRLPDGSSRVVKLMSVLGNSLVNQRLFPDIEEMRLLNQPASQMMGMPVLNLNSNPHEGTNRVLKALEDRVLSLAILILILPVLLVIAALIKADSPGPVIFKQKRHGVDGRPFNIYKFRSMIVHEESGGAITQARRSDDRVTRIGAFLRRTSLDELPQFINVLQGRMSIVGPRPHAVAHNDYFKERILKYMQRHRVKPGITGWAQINGFRGETPDIDSMRQRVNFDLYYIDNWSLWFDLKIIGRTIVRGFRDSNAY